MVSLCLQALVNEYPIDIDERDPNGHEASPGSWHGLAVCELRVHRRHSPLMLSAIHGRLEVTDFLLRRGAQLHAVDTVFG